MTVAQPLLAEAAWIGRARDHVPEFTPRSGPQGLPLALAECQGSLLLRTAVEVPAGLRRATLRMTARGCYLSRLGGRRVSLAQLAPTWTDYRHRYAVQQIDVTHLLGAGPTVWSVELGTGWYSGFLGMDRGHQARHYGDHPAFRGELEMVDEAGAITRVVTDESWTLGEGATMHADMMQGQMIDPRREPSGWADAVETPDGFEPARRQPEDSAALVLQTAPDIVVRERLRPLSARRTQSGALVLDVGQNIVGRVRLRIAAAVEGYDVGSHVHVRHGEALDADGEVYTENLRWASAHDVAVVTTDPWVFDPELTFHGFRYVEVRGYPGELDLEDVEILVIGPQIDQVGSFACSHRDVETLHANVVRTIRNNLVGAPTDCPQRDERLGWMGDANIISSTALFALDLQRYLDSWLADVRTGQHENGAFPDVAPRVLVEVEGAPGWADAGILIPWRMHRTARSVSSLRTLRDHYPAMVRFMEYLERSNPDHYRSRRLSRNYGDWLHLDDPTAKADLATAYWALCADAMAGIAADLGRTDDAERWGSTAASVRTAWWARHGGSVPTSGASTQSQTSLAMALVCRLVPEQARPAVAEQLRAAVLGRGQALSTGIHGTRFLLPALSDSGSLDLAYALLLRRHYPSWLHAVDAGATTIWERWDGWTQEAGFQTPFMNSLNHYALGSVGEWMHEYVAGLRPGAQGYRTPVIRPYPSRALTWAHASRVTDDGLVSSAWRIDGDTLVLEVSSPEGALVSLPTSELSRIEVPDDADPVADAWSSYMLSAGSHTLACAWNPSWRPAPRLPDTGWA